MSAVPAPLLSNATLDRSIRVLGSPASLDPLFRRLASGLPITLGVLGSSVGQNAGCLDQPGKRCMHYSGINRRQKGWAVLFLEHINSRFPHSGHRIDNAALDATPVAAFSNCLFSHLSADVHLVVAEWGSMGNHNHHQLPHIEQVATTLLALPARPVVLHLSVQEWCTQKISPRQFYRVGDLLMGRTTNGFVYPDTPWARVDLESTRVCGHYQQPCISVKEALEPHVLNGDPGFGLRDITGDDCLHPINGRHGVAYHSAMLAHWFDHAHELWQRTRSERRQPFRLPPPLHLENRVVSGDKGARCYVFRGAGSKTPQSQRRVSWCSPQGGGGTEKGRQKSCTPKLSGGGATCRGVEASQASMSPAARRKANNLYRAGEQERQTATTWFWCPVSLGSGRRKPSAGVVALVPGAVLIANVDAFLPAALPGGEHLDNRAVDAATHTGTNVTLLIEHLVSYEGMGRVGVRCGGGCSCVAHVIDAHRIDETRNSSIFVSTPVRARALSSSQPCELRLTLLRGSSSGQHKFKLRGIAVRGG